MPTEKIISETITNLAKSLNLRSIQHKALASNIANMDTPNYKAVELDVSEKMQKNKGILVIRTLFESRWGCQRNLDCKSGFFWYRVPTGFEPRV